MKPVQIVRVAVVSLFVFLSSCAPPGYHYGTWSATSPAQAFQLQPNDACRDQRLVSPGAIQDMNTSVDKPEGLPKPVASIASISSVGYGPPLGFNQGPPASVQCYETVAFTDGSQQTSVVDIINETDGLAVSWTPQPPPVSPQQAARATLAAEAFQDASTQCSSDYDEKISEVSNLTLEAQANNSAFNQREYIMNAANAESSCQQNASQEYQNAIAPQQ